MRQWIDLRGLAAGVAASLWLDVAEAGEGVGAVDVHGAGTADSLAAGAAEGEGWVLLVFDFDECVEDHWAAFFEIDWIG